MKERNIALDVIRCMALYMVISVHFFLNNGFYGEICIGPRMYIATVFRSLFMTCVPLFIVLTGYLMNEKKLSKKYYSGIKKTLGIYILASVVCTLYKNIFLDMNISIMQMIMGILDFSAAPYAWYVEMYIGLYIMIPFLNIIYANLSTKREKQILVISFIALIALPSLTNISYKIFPIWWLGCYPIMYYFIGCYLKEYGLKITLLKNSVLFVLVLIIAGTMNYYLSFESTFVLSLWSEYFSFFTVCLTILLFNFFVSINFNNIFDGIKKILKYFSDWCFGAYLVSYIFDILFYPILTSSILDVQMRFKYYFIIVPIVFICSLCLSALINSLYAVFVRIYHNLCSIKNKKHIKTEIM